MALDRRGPLVKLLPNSSIECPNEHRLDTFHEHKHRLRELLVNRILEGPEKTIIVTGRLPIGVKKMEK